MCSRRTSWWRGHVLRAARAGLFARAAHGHRAVQVADVAPCAAGIVLAEGERRGLAIAPAIWATAAAADRRTAATRGANPHVCAKRLLVEKVRGLAVAASEYRRFVAHEQGTSAFLAADGVEGGTPCGGSPPPPPPSGMQPPGSSLLAMLLLRGRFDGQTGGERLGLALRLARSAAAASSARRSVSAAVAAAASAAAAASSSCAGRVARSWSM